MPLVVTEEGTEPTVLAGDHPWATTTHMPLAHVPVFLVRRQPRWHSPWQQGNRGMEVSKILRASKQTGKVFLTPVDSAFPKSRACPLPLCFSPLCSTRVSQSSGLPSSTPLDFQSPTWPSALTSLGLCPQAGCPSQAGQNSGPPVPETPSSPSAHPPNLPLPWHSHRNNLVKASGQTARRQASPCTPWVLWPQWSSQCLENRGDVTSPEPLRDGDGASHPVEQDWWQKV